MTMPHEAETITEKRFPWDIFEEKPLCVEAIQFVMSPEMVAGFAAGDRIVFFGCDVQHDGKNYFFKINLLDGVERCYEKGWIVRHPKDGLVIHTEDEFSAAYRKVQG